jgi:hypothetical protein
MEDLGPATALTFRFVEFVCHQKRIVQIRVDEVGVNLYAYSTYSVGTSSKQRLNERVNVL